MKALLKQTLWTPLLVLTLLIGWPMSAVSMPADTEACRLRKGQALLVHSFVPIMLGRTHWMGRL